MTERSAAQSRRRRGARQGDAPRPGRGGRCRASRGGRPDGSRRGRSRRASPAPGCAEGAYSGIGAGSPPGGGVAPGGGGLYGPLPATDISATSRLPLLQIPRTKTIAASRKGPSRTLEHAPDLLLGKPQRRLRLGRKEAAPDDVEASASVRCTGPACRRGVDGEVPVIRKSLRREGESRVEAREVSKTRRNVSWATSWHPRGRRAFDGGTPRRSRCGRERAGRRILIPAFASRPGAVRPWARSSSPPAASAGREPINGHARWFYGSPPGVVYRPLPEAGPAGREHPRRLQCRLSDGTVTPRDARSEHPRSHGPSGLPVSIRPVASCRRRLGAGRRLDCRGLGRARSRPPTPRSGSQGRAPRPVAPRTSPTPAGVGLLGGGSGASPRPARLQPSPSISSFRPTPPRPATPRLARPRGDSALASPPYGRPAARPAGPVASGRLLRTLPARRLRAAGCLFRGRRGPLPRWRPNARGRGRFASIGVPESRTDVAGTRARSAAPPEPASRRRSVPSPRAGRSWSPARLARGGAHLVLSSSTAPSRTRESPRFSSSPPVAPRPGTRRRIEPVRPGWAWFGVRRPADPCPADVFSSTPDR